MTEVDQLDDLERRKWLALFNSQPDIEDLRVAATTRTYDSSVAVPVYRPFRVISFLSNGTYSKTLNNFVGDSPRVVFHGEFLFQGERTP